MPASDVSVVMANYNHARYLPRALDPILAQSPRPREVVVVDDASTDDSLDVLDGYAKRDPLVRVVRHDRNRGAVATFNHALSLAAGQYVFLASADDYVRPGFFARAAAQLDAHPDAPLYFGLESVQYGDDAAPVEHPNGFARGGYFTPDEVALGLRRLIPGTATVYRTKLLTDFGGFLPDLHWYSDWFASITLAFRHGVCYEPASCAVRVLYPSGYAGGIVDRSRNVRAIAAFLDRVLGPACADVYPRYCRNATAEFFGPDLYRAAAARPDRWNPKVLALLPNLRDDDFRALLDDPDPAVRDLAAHRAGPHAVEAADHRRGLADEVRHLREVLAATRAELVPPGVGGKLRWLAGRVAGKVRRRNAG